MKRFRIIFFFVILLSPCVVALAEAGILQGVSEALKNAYPMATFERRGIVLSDTKQSVIEQKANISFKKHPLSNIVYYVARDKNGIAGYAFEDTVIGKWGLIHYFLAVDPDGKITNVNVLDFKERRGRPAAKKSFTNQFIGKNITNPLRLRRDINGVTGATITSTSLTDGIRKLLYLFEEIKKM